MAYPPSGIIGNFVAQRPVLSNSILGAGFVALFVAGGRALGGFTEILKYLGWILYAFAIPALIASAAPRPLLLRVAYGVGITLVALLLMAAAQWPGQSPAPAPPLLMTGTALGVVLYLLSVAPLSSNVIRLGRAAPFAAFFGAAAGAGALAVAGDLAADDAGLILALGLAIGTSAGASIAADFAKLFAKGAPKMRAVAAAGHGAVAPSAHTLMTVLVFFSLYSWTQNFGAIDWDTVSVCMLICGAAILAAMTFVPGSISIISITEQTAADENRRHSSFSRNWRPLRLWLPMSTAFATMAIIGVITVIALFELGVAAPGMAALFLTLTSLSGAIAFVSIRTGLLISVLLCSAMVLTAVAHRLLGLELPSDIARFAALTLCATSLGHLTVSWRDARDVWRRPRDIVENALNDGVRRWLFFVVAGAAAILVSMQAFLWGEALSTLIYFLFASLFCLILAPAAMMALSVNP